MSLYVCPACTQKLPSLDSQTSHQRQQSIEVKTTNKADLRQLALFKSNQATLSSVIEFLMVHTPYQGARIEEHTCTHFAIEGKEVIWIPEVRFLLPSPDPKDKVLWMEKLLVIFEGYILAIQ